MFALVICHFLFIHLFYIFLLALDIVPLYDERAVVQEDCDPGDSL